MSVFPTDTFWAGLELVSSVVSGDTPIYLATNTQDIDTALLFGLLPEPFVHDGSVNLEGFGANSSWMFLCVGDSPDNMNQNLISHLRTLDAHFKKIDLDALRQVMSYNDRQFLDYQRSAFMVANLHHSGFGTKDLIATIPACIYRLALAMDKPSAEQLADVIEELVGGGIPSYVRPDLYFSDYSPQMPAERRQNIVALLRHYPCVEKFYMQTMLSASLGAYHNDPVAAVFLFTEDTEMYLRDVVQMDIMLRFREQNILPQPWGGFVQLINSEPSVRAQESVTKPIYDRFRIWRPNDSEQTPE